MIIKRFVNDNGYDYSPDVYNHNNISDSQDTRVFFIIIIVVIRNIIKRLVHNSGYRYENRETCGTFYLKGQHVLHSDKYL